MSLLDAVKAAAESAFKVAAPFLGQITLTRSDAPVWDPVVDVMTDNTASMVTIPDALRDDSRRFANAEQTVGTAFSFLTARLPTGYEPGNGDPVFDANGTRWLIQRAAIGKVTTVLEVVRA